VFLPPLVLIIEQRELLLALLLGGVKCYRVQVLIFACPPAQRHGAMLMEAEGVTGLRAAEPKC